MKDSISILECVNPELVAAFRRRMDTAVLAERERCAKIVRDHLAILDRKVDPGEWMYCEFADALIQIETGEN